MVLNKKYIHQKLPHIDKLITENFETLLKKSEVIVITHMEKILEQMHIPQDKIIIDLVRIKTLENHPNYKGICW